MKRANNHAGKHTKFFDTRFVSTDVEHTRKSGISQRVDNRHYLNDAGRLLLQTKSGQESKQAVVMVWKYPTTKSPTITVKCSVTYGDLGDDQASPPKPPIMTLEIFGTHGRGWTPPVRRKRKVTREV